MGRLPAAGTLRVSSIAAALVFAVALLFTACHHLEYVSVLPLDEAGFSYSSIQQLRQLDISKAEVAELVTARNGHVSEETCVELLRIARGHKEPFTGGEAVAALHAAGIADADILELDRLRQLGIWAGEAQAIRLAGISGRVIVARARRRGAGEPIPSGASLAHMKDAGVGEATLYELVNRGVTDADAEVIAKGRKKRGATDEQVLRDFPPAKQ
jgi:hypothetical protein